MFKESLFETSTSFSNIHFTTCESDVIVYCFLTFSIAKRVPLCSSLHLFGSFTEKVEKAILDILLGKEDVMLRSKCDATALTL